MFNKIRQSIRHEKGVDKPKKDSEKSNRKTLQRLPFCSIFLKVERTYVHPEWSTHSTLEFLASKKSRVQIPTQASHSIWVGMELILFCCRMTGCRLDIPAAFFQPSRRGNGFKIFLQPLPRTNIDIPGTHNVTHLPASLIKKNRSHGLPTETEEAY